MLLPLRLWLLLQIQRTEIFIREGILNQLGVKIDFTSTQYKSIAWLLFNSLYSLPGDTVLLKQKAFGVCFSFHLALFLWSEDSDGLKPAHGKLFYVYTKVIL